MICRIAGTVIERRDDSLIIEVNGMGYQVLVPRGVLRCLGEDDPAISLITYHYVQTDPAKGIPMLIGFRHEAEREFFEKFITVSGIGPKAALRALSEPIALIAQAIDAGNVAFLKGLPGIGPQRAREIVAKLQGKVGKYALIQYTVAPEPVASAAPEALTEEAVAVLIQLQYKRPEALTMVKQALSRNPAIQNTEELLNEVYRQKLIAA